MTTKEKIKQKESQIRNLQLEIDELKKTEYNGIYLDDSLETIADFNKLLAERLGFYNIKTVRQLINTSQDDILKIPGIGCHKIQVIRSWIEKHKLYL